ncbi:MAG: hypothetical protein PUC63_00330 [Clostridiales bacterium]|nr:hypothetical protein [Clostridiales bacterium]
MPESVEHICVYCVHSDGDSDKCYCLYKGETSPRGHCRRFRLDLLKITPRPPVSIGKADELFSDI